MNLAYTFGISHFFVDLHCYVFCFVLFCCVVNKDFLIPGLLVRDDLSWDDHILQICKTMNHYVHVLCRLNKIFPKQLLLKIYKSYVQSKLDYGLSIWGCTPEGNLDRVQRIQNFCARIICKNYDYINTRGIDLVDSLKIQTIRQCRDHFLSVLMFKAIHGLAPHYLYNDVTMMLMSMVIILGARKIWIYMYRNTPKKYANVVSHIKEACYGMTCPMR